MQISLRPLESGLMRRHIPPHKTAKELKRLQFDGTAAEELTKRKAGSVFFVDIAKTSTILPACPILVHTERPCTEPSWN